MKPNQNQESKTCPGDSSKAQNINSSIEIYENEGAFGSLGFGPIGFNYGYGTKNGYDNGEFRSYGISFGTGKGVSFGAVKTKYLFYF